MIEGDLTLDKILEDLEMKERLILEQYQKLEDNARTIAEDKKKLEAQNKFISRDLQFDGVVSKI